MRPVLPLIDKKIIPADRLELPEFIAKEIEIDVLRLDKIHDVISGNKWFKLKNWLVEASQKKSSDLLTFGGAFSNHIIATACVAKEAGMGSIGFIRGEPQGIESHTLVSARQYGMRLQFISREEYKRKDSPDFRDSLAKRFPSACIIPEGGAGMPGIRGCEEILQRIEKKTYTHLVCAVGTGTMYLGLANGSAARQFITGIPVLKGMPDLLGSYRACLNDPGKINYCQMHYGYHFGGYAKKNAELIYFMNKLYEQSGIPTDFVYTAKMFYAALDLVNKRYFFPGSKLLLIHSGGLQGNLSLPAGALNF